MSAKTGVAPIIAIAPAEAMNEFGAVMTSSPGPMPSALKIRISASVPEFTPIAWRAPQSAAKRFSNSSTAGPSVDWPVLRSPRMQARISSASASCVSRYEYLTFMRCRSPAGSSPELPGLHGLDVVVADVRHRIRHPPVAERRREIADRIGDRAPGLEAELALDAVRR